PKKPPASKTAPKAAAPRKPPARNKEERTYTGPLRVNAPPKRPDLLLFGTGGTPHSADPRDHPGAVRRLHELGLGAYEMEFVHGVRIRPESCEEVHRLQCETGVRVTAHGPYYINLFSLEEEKLAASRARVLDTARALARCGGDGACFHPGFYQGRDAGEVYAHMKQELAGLADALREEGCPVRLDPETTGKESQFGSLDELTRLRREARRENLGLTLDFSHIHARSGGAFNTYEEFGSLLELIRNRNGKAALQDMHIHLSGIAYGGKGEKHHLDVDESDMNYPGLLRALIDFGCEGLVVCESPGLEYDALILQRAYRELHGG
ncbi:MAG: TIM barrel protein, partial [Nitrospinota bacterium]